MMMVVVVMVMLVLLVLLVLPVEVKLKMKVLCCGGLVDWWTDGNTAPGDPDGQAAQWAAETREGPSMFWAILSCWGIQTPFPLTLMDANGRSIVSYCFIAKTWLVSHGSEDEQPRLPCSWHEKPSPEIGSGYWELEWIEDNEGKWPYSHVFADVCTGHGSSLFLCFLW